MVNQDAIFTRHYMDYAQLPILSHSLYLYQTRIEERSTFADKIRQSGLEDVVFYEIKNKDEENDIIEISSIGEVCSLRSKERIKQLLLNNGNISNVYIDASGLNIRSIAPLLKCAVELSVEKNFKLFIVYAEPSEYKVRRFSEEGEYLDLSERIKGVYPIPGFEMIKPSAGLVLFIPFLGFEGGRFAYVWSKIESMDVKIVPIVGVSGYRLEYPFVSFYGNRRPLEDTNSWGDVKYAMAGSIVDAFHVLSKLRTKNTGTLMKIAPLGTKPHSIAALLFACCYPRNTEIVYDNPIREKQRTVGVGKVSVTCISELIKKYYNA